jgi:hypothetical protein
VDAKLFLHLVTYIVTPIVPTLEYYVHLSVITAYFNAFQRSNSTPASRTGRAVLYAKCHITSRVVNRPLARTRHIATPLNILTCFINPYGPGEGSRYSDTLQAGRSGDRIPVGARFYIPVQAGLQLAQPPLQLVPGHFSWDKAAGAWR